MPRMPRVTASELEAALRRDGWHEVRQRGSHRHYAHPEKRGIVTVPFHSGEQIGPELLKRILRQAGLTPDNLPALL